MASEAGVAPTTLYRLFASKDDLVAAYVERADRLHREWFAAAIEAAGPDPRARILAVFDALAEEIQPRRCRGCPFQMSLAELADRDLPAYRHAVATKRWIRARFGELAAELARVAPVSDPDALADQLTLVMEGVYASALSLGAEGPATQGRAVVEVLIGAR